MKPLVLASSSAYRRALLDRLGLAYETCAPDIDERRMPGESPETLVARLAGEKAAAVAQRHSAALIIGSDQVAVLEGEVLGKPGGAERARRQLMRASGKRVQFLTGLVLLNSDSDELQADVVPYTVQFRDLSAEQIARYVEHERPYDCAGSFKAEGLGIALFERMQGEDPNALIGLPLIRLVSFLARAGITLP